ncbi:hypothetical protein D3C86_1457590 [compost metagenome]
MSTYSNLKTQLVNTYTAFLLMQDQANAVDNGELSDELLAISTNLDSISTWVEQKEEQELLSQFLAAQKALMQEYGLVISVVEVAPGYGEEYGTTESAIQMSVTKDGVSAVKVFDTISVDQSDID